MNYQGIISISNEIRFVLNTSREVNLAAQNASLAARRAGNALGFQAVSTELKNFSQSLATAMNDMSSDILAIAQGVSGVSRQAHFSRHQQNAMGLCQQPDELLKISLERAEERQHQMHRTLAERLQQLNRRLRRSLNLVNNGRALARSALIESTAGGESESILKKVAYDIERTIEDIFARLKVIGTCLYEEKELA